MTELESAWRLCRHLRGFLFVTLQMYKHKYIGDWPSNVLTMGSITSCTKMRAPGPMRRFDHTSLGNPKQLVIGMYQGVHKVCWI